MPICSPVTHTKIRISRTLLHALVFVFLWLSIVDNACDKVIATMAVQCFIQNEKYRKTLKIPITIRCLCVFILLITVCCMIRALIILSDKTKFVFFKSFTILRWTTWISYTIYVLRLVTNDCFTRNISVSRPSSYDVRMYVQCTSAYQ